MRVPKSKVRAKPAYTPPPTRNARKRPSPPWVAPLMVGCLLVGIVWLVLFYVTNAAWPISAFGNYNLIVGFVFIVAGLGIATQWR